MKHLVLAAALAAAACSAPALAAGTTTVAQGTGQRFLTIADYDPLGQVFTADGNRLDSFGFQLQTVSTTADNGAITLSIYAGSAAAGTPLGTAVATPTGLPATRTPTWVDWTFTSLALTAGQTYTAALTGATTRVALVFGPNTSPFGGGVIGGDAYAGGGLLSTGYSDRVCNTGICDANFRFTTSDVAAAVPEPASWAVMTAGFGLLGAALRRRRGTALRLG